VKQKEKQGRRGAIKKERRRFLIERKGVRDQKDIKKEEEGQEGK